MRSRISQHSRQCHITYTAQAHWKGVNRSGQSGQVSQVIANPAAAAAAAAGVLRLLVLLLTCPLSSHCRPTTAIQPETDCCMSWHHPAGAAQHTGNAAHRQRSTAQHTGRSSHKSPGCTLIRSWLYHSPQAESTLPPAAMTASCTHTGILWLSSAQCLMRQKQS